MPDLTRRGFLADTAIVSAGLTIGGVAADPAIAKAAPPVVRLSWLGNAAPALPAGVAWGVPWPRGAVAKQDRIAVRDAGGKAIAAQSWPLAYWPDGSIKWTGLAVAASAETAELSVSAGGAAGPAPATRVRRQGLFRRHA